jgi:hypothetical protein
LEKKPSKGKALTLLAHQWARAVYDMFKRQTAFDMNTFLHGAGRRGGELGASLDSHGMPLISNALHVCVSERS